jgi:hypothetical protein
LWLSPRYSELTKKQLESGKYQDVEGYACLTDKKGNVLRVEDPERTKSCHNILSQLFNSLGLPEGSGIDALENAVEQGTELLIDVKAEEYEGKTQLRVAKTRKATAAVATVSEASADLDRF